MLLINSIFFNYNYEGILQYVDNFLKNFSKRFKKQVLAVNCCSKILKKMLLEIVFIKQHVADLKFFFNN